jgi:outer membrane lipoprotein-sorting protein
VEYASIVCALALTGLGASSQAGPEVESLLSAMRKSYRDVTSVQLQVRLKQYFPTSRRTRIFSLDYVRPNRIRYVSAVGAERVSRFSDGKRVVTFRTDRRAEETLPSPANLGRQLPGNLEWLCFFDWEKQLSTSAGNNMSGSRLRLLEEQTWNGKQWIVLDEEAPEVDVHARYFIHPETKLIWRCEVKRLSTRTLFLVTEVTKLVLNPKLNPSLFDPPARRGQAN